MCLCLCRTCKLIGNCQTLFKGKFICNLWKVIECNGIHLCPNLIEDFVLFSYTDFFLSTDFYLIVFPFYLKTDFKEMMYKYVLVSFILKWLNFCLGVVLRGLTLILIYISIILFYNTKHPLPTTQEKTLHIDITRWSTPKSDWLYCLQPKMEKLCTVRNKQTNKQKTQNQTGSWLSLRSWTPYCQIHT